MFGVAFIPLAIAANQSKSTFAPFPSDSTNFWLLSWMAPGNHVYDLYQMIYLRYLHILFLPLQTEDIEKVKQNDTAHKPRGRKLASIASTAFFIQDSHTTPIIKYTQLPLSYKYNISTVHTP